MNDHEKDLVEYENEDQHHDVPLRYRIADVLVEAMRVNAWELANTGDSF